MAQAHFPLRISAILIDLDGTLLHTAPELAEAANRMLRDMGRPAVSQDLLMSYIGNGIGWLVKRALTGDMHAEPDAALFEKALPVFEKHYTGLLLQSKPYHGVPAGLEAMKEVGFRLGCITNKVARYTEPLLKGLGLTDYFEIVLSGDSLPEKKPSHAAVACRSIFWRAGRSGSADRRFAQRCACRARRRLPGILRSLRL